MSKRLNELSKEETNLRKKVKMELDAISEKIAEKHSTINIDEHKIEKILLIFHLLLEANTYLTKEGETDNAEYLTIVTITNRLIKLLQDNIESLNIADTPNKHSKK